MNKQDDSQVNQDTNANLPDLNGSNKKKNHHHREIITTVQNGVKHVQITEVHVGGDIAGMFNMGVPTIVVGRPKNLKAARGEASPFKLLKELDSMFDSFFDSIFEDMIHQQIEAEHQFEKMAEDMQKRKQEDIDLMQNNHHGHITVTGIKDIKSDELVNATNTNFSTLSSESEKIEPGSPAISSEAPITIK